MKGAVDPDSCQDYANHGEHQIAHEEQKTNGWSTEAHDENMSACEVPEI